MIGHQQIVDARQRGRKPKAIFFELGIPAKPEAVRCGPLRKSLRDALYDPESAMDAGLFPVVYVDPDEDPDFRFAIGCQAHVSDVAWSQKLIELGQSLAAAGASLVVVSAPRETDELMIFENGEWRTE